MKTSLRVLPTAALLLALAAALTTAVAGPPPFAGPPGKPGVWPSKQGTICFSTQVGGAAAIRMHVSNMGGGYYFIAGTNDEGPDEGVSRFSGSAQVDGAWVYIHVTTSANPPDRLNETRASVASADLYLGGLTPRASVYGLTITATEGEESRIEYDDPAEIYVVPCQ